MRTGGQVTSTQRDVSPRRSDNSIRSRLSRGMCSPRIHVLQQFSCEFPLGNAYPIDPSIRRSLGIIVLVLGLIRRIPTSYVDSSRFQWTTTIVPLELHAWQ